MLDVPANDGSTNGDSDHETGSDSSGDVEVIGGNIVSGMGQGTGQW